MFPILLQLLLVALLAQGATEKRPNLIVNTSSGRVQGYADTTTIPDTPLLKWLGIPYAQDTSGQNRWKPPQPLERSKNIIDASSFGPACLQGRYLPSGSSFINYYILTTYSYVPHRADGGNGTSLQSEDCLRINIIAPANASKLPVYLYSQ